MQHSHILDIDQIGNPESDHYNDLKDHPSIRMTIREVMDDPTIFTDITDMALYEYLVWDTADASACDAAGINFLTDFDHFDATKFVCYRQALLKQSDINEIEEEIVRLKETVVRLQKEKEEALIQANILRKF